MSQHTLAAGKPISWSTLSLIPAFADLAASGFSQDAILKWYFHPTVGVRMRTGKFVDESVLPPDVREMYQAAESEAAGSGAGQGLDGLDFMDGLEDVLKQYVPDGDLSKFPFEKIDLFSGNAAEKQP